MQKTAIYFLSGSGNSYYTAKSIAEKINADLYNLSNYLGKSSLNIEARQIGLVFPVVGGNMHKLVRKFVDIIADRDTKTFFAVCTCCIGPGHSLLNLDKILKKAGSKLSYGFSILQPQSGIGSKILNTPDLIEERIHNQKEKINEIVTHIQNEKTCVIEKSGKYSEFFNSKTLQTLPTIFKLLYHLLSKGIDAMRFKPTARCNGCKICVQLCPVGNITMEGNLPKWGKNCVGCMGCYHWCPLDAVHSVDLNMTQYHHPKVTVKEFLKAVKK